MAQSLEEIKAILKPRQLITLTCKGPVKFNGKSGYVGEIFEDTFEYLEVINAYEHFSNISDPPETKVHVIRYQDVIELKK